MGQFFDLSIYSLEIFFSWCVLVYIDFANHLVYSSMHGTQMAYSNCVVCIQMRIHSSASHKLPTSKCSDYFFNYFTLGLVRAHVTVT